jgi:hypothetical protein
MSLVKYKIIESKGFSDHEKPAQEALDNINAYIQQQGGWLYLDKHVITNVNTITTKDLEDASIVTVTHVVLGGVDRCED